ncbi:MAG: DUF2959 domain-containing protein [Vicinamibacterales bacterium]
MTVPRPARRPPPLLPDGFRALCLALVALTASTACESWYYKTMKKFGVEKRDILVRRIKDARKSQVDAKEEFASALDRFRSVVEVDGGSLEEKYDQLNKALERAEDRARNVHERVAAVRNVSDDLFSEWTKELGQYSDRSLRAESERELQATKRKADALTKAMGAAERRLDPVLQPLRDRVLFLKHNLNAQAIGALTKELAGVQANVDVLVTELDKSIAEADAFIKEMDAGGGEAPPAPR